MGNTKNPSSKDSLSCRLLKLICHRTSEADGDEIYLKFRGTKMWPAKTKFEKIGVQNQKDLRVNFETAPQEEVQLELWEYDTFSLNDFLGKFVFIVDKAGGPYTTDLKHSDKVTARYSLVWEAQPGKTV